MATTTDTRNRRNAILFVNGEGAVATISGYYRDDNLKQYKVDGQHTEDALNFTIIDEDTGEVVGGCDATPRTDEPRNDKDTIVAKGTLTFRDESFPVCLVPAELKDGEYGYGLFPDKFGKRRSGFWGKRA